MAVADEKEKRKKETGLMKFTGQKLEGNAPLKQKAKKEKMILRVMSCVLIFFVMSN